MFEATVNFEPVSLKRHRHRLKGGTYDPSKKDKDDFIKVINNLLPYLNRVVDISFTLFLD